MTSKQIQEIQDSLALAKEKMSQISKGGNTLSMTPAQQGRYNYWDGKATAYREVLRFLDA